MSEKKFSEMTDAAIWADFKNSHDEWAMIMNAIYGPSWCCRLAKRYQRVTTKEGIKMRMYFCPRCGKSLER